MASSVIKTKRDGKITLTDGTGTPQSLEIQFETGDISITIPGPTVNNFLDRGKFGPTPQVRFGDDQPCTWSFTANLLQVTDSAAALLTDIVTNGGFFASDWVSTLSANAEVKTVKMRFDIEGTDHGDAADHFIELDHCFVTGSISDGDPMTISISGTAFTLYPVVG